jgi:Glycosyl hydrolases family 16
MTRRTALVVIALLGLTTVPSYALRAAAAVRVPVPHATVHCRRHIASRNEPSRLAPPGANSMRGYTLAYCLDFTGSTLPWGWDVFSGVPGGDPGGYFEPSHVVVHDGVLDLEAYKDPAHHGVWATGGICQCGAPRTYGAYFVRSRSIGVGPDDVELLWPVAHTWPPEVDFNESSQYPTSSTWTVHYAPGDRTVARTDTINLRHWHTWGVVWTPRSLTFTVDHVVWGMVTESSAIPTGAMTLDIQSQSYCGVAPECPTAPAKLEVDWLEEFTKT